MLEGRLGDFTLPDILRLLAFTSKTGRLWVSREGVAARVDLLEGRIRDASADVACLGLARRLIGQDLLDAERLAQVLGDVEAMPTDLELARHLVETDTLDSSVLADLAREQLVDALFGLLRWEDGAFRFQSAPAEQRGPSVLDLALTVDDALDEVGRRLEAHAAIEQRTGHADAVVTIRRPGRERAEVALSPEGWTLLALIDGHRTVSDLVRLSGQGDYRTRRTLASLLDEGIVTVGDVTEPAPAERLVTAHRLLAEHEARLADDHEEVGTSQDPAQAPASPSPAAPSAPSAAAPGASAESPQGAVHTTDPKRTASAESPQAGAARVEPSPAASAESPPSTRDAMAISESAPDPAASAASPSAASASAASPSSASASAESPSSGSTHEATPPGVTSLRARARRPQLRTDPEVDEDLVRRLIDGVESL